MNVKVTLGGERLGSGKKSDIQMHGYGRSNHNLSKVVRTSAGVGILYPIYTNIMLPGDEIKMKIESLVKTIPTIAPMFGSFKMQIDVFQAPFRLYQGVLHNNPVDIGLKMNQVYLPTIRLEGTAQSVLPDNTQASKDISNNCLIKYLGMSGLGSAITTNQAKQREINAVPVFAYFDIFKNYYSNKQEENFKQITNTKISVIQANNYSYYRLLGEETGVITSEGFGNGLEIDGTTTYTRYIFNEKVTKSNWKTRVALRTESDDDEIRTITVAELENNYNVSAEWVNVKDYISNSKIGYAGMVFGLNKESLGEKLYGNANAISTWEWLSVAEVETNEIETVDIPLKEIDALREDILGTAGIGSKFSISTSQNYGKYKFIDNITERSNNVAKNLSPLNGLVLKTYQSDLFNNWIQTDWISGANGIAAMSAVSTSGGSFTMDTLNMAEKVYNMLNRIAVGGGTFQEWIEAVYTKKARRHIESPVYLGSYAGEIGFEEIVSTAEAGDNPLGTLAGKGKMYGQHGGVIKANADEPCVIMAIMSITPRIDYSQGNKWYLTDIKTLNDLHKPGLDGIGFQDLIAEQMAWWAAPINQGLATRQSVGKVPAWINYMTDINETFGDFASDGKFNYMVLTRNYKRGIRKLSQGGQAYDQIEDATTYIDPEKYNYAFADTGLNSQNFWVQVGFDIKARRIMSAKQIPNL